MLHEQTRARFKLQLKIDPASLFAAAKRTAGSSVAELERYADRKAKPTAHIVLIALLAIGVVAHAQLPDADFAARLVEATMERLSHTVRYDGSYRVIDYPNGDVPDHIGVCTDLVVRAYRAVGLDLQRAVHEDIKANFAKYPQSWGHSGPDPNIDHRRVPNLQVFFARNGVTLPISSNAQDYRPGDLVTWMLPGNLPHIGVVVTRRSSDGRRPLIVHNIGAGPDIEDMLFKFPITGHYRYDGSRKDKVAVRAQSD